MAGAAASSSPRRCCCRAPTRFASPSSSHRSIGCGLCAVLMTGQAARRGIVCVERLARNTASPAAPDNRGTLGSIRTGRPGRDRDGGAGAGNRPGPTQGRDRGAGIVRRRRLRLQPSLLPRAPASGWRGAADPRGFHPPSGDSRAMSAGGEPSPARDLDRRPRAADGGRGPGEGGPRPAVGSDGDLERLRQLVLDRLERLDDGLLRGLGEILNCTTTASVCLRANSLCKLTRSVTDFAASDALTKSKLASALACAAASALALKAITPSLAAAKLARTRWRCPRPTPSPSRTRLATRRRPSGARCGPIPAFREPARRSPRRLRSELGKLVREVGLDLGGGRGLVGRALLR